jgi:type I restriction-modification system DNA methylase subunit
MAEIQVKTKRRVSNYGEVYTAPREVNAMLDLVKQETERIESRFLEPACGNGNFLIEVLESSHISSCLYGIRGCAQHGR